jgi:hypothetical protein
MESSMNKVFVMVVGLILSFHVLAEALAVGTYYVSANRLSVRLGPSTAATTTNTLSKKQKVKVYEVKSGWARISKYYNGVVEGKSAKVARWVFAQYLSSRKPEDDFSSDTPLEKAIEGSNNYSLYRDNFIRLSEKLIDQGRCSVADYKEMGGWLRSSNHKPKPIYFTYCGGFSKGNKVYIDAESGAIL